MQAEWNKCDEREKSRSYLLQRFAAVMQLIGDCAMLIALPQREHQ
jgi:hypothetical protein